MKIGILTQPLHNNYGGILQNYALQKVLKKMGHEVYTIDRDVHKPFFLKGASLLKYSLKRLSGDKRRIRRWMTTTERDIISLNTSNFIDKHIDKTEKVISNDELIKLHKTFQFDAYIVGSDQVWRPQYSPCLSNYFLDFLPLDKKIKRIAYSASFGVDTWELNKKETQIAKSLIGKFDSISVREDSAIDLCKKHLGVDAIQTADPTLLLDKRDYEDIIDKKIDQNKGNLFVYILDETPANNQFVNKIAGKYGLTPFKIMPERNFLASSKMNLKECIFPPVEKWISAFRDAKLIITDSFHGTIFSAIFQKPFISLHNQERGTSRFTSLARLFESESRFVQDTKEIIPSIQLSKEEIERIQYRTNIIRQRSFDFLKSSLE